MVIEWSLMVLLLSGAGFLFFQKWATSGVRLAFLLFVAAASLAGWWWQTRLEKGIASRASLNAPTVGRPEEFAGSASCRACHPDQYASWHRSYHRTMTQIASPETVRGNFNNVTLKLDNDEYRLERRGDEFWVDMVDPDWSIQERRAATKPSTLSAGAGETPPPRAQCRVTMMTGSHHMQTYWVDNQHGNRQFNFPFVYLFEQDRWVPRRSAFIRDPAAHSWIQVWNVGCINCHATAGQPRQSQDSSNFGTRVAELGIACEACHGPAVEHVRLNSDPRRRYSLHFQKKGDASIVQPAKLSSKRSSEVCGRCHSVHASRDNKDWLENGERYRPGEELETKMQILRTQKIAELRHGYFWNDGMIRVSGREYNGLIRSPCFLKGEMSCLSCHSMHESSPVNQLAADRDSNTACLQCHASFAKNLEQHTHHAAGSSGSLCYNCHMPFTTYGLLKALRSHQISSPSVTAALQAGRPNACNLCHLDKTLDWTAQKLATWYQIPTQDLASEEKTIAASVLWTLKGDAGQRALTAWHMGWKPARDASLDWWLPPYLAMLLDDPYPAVRYIAGRSVKRLPGYDGFSYDYLATPDELRRCREQALEIWTHQAKAAPHSSLLVGEDGRLEQDTVNKLLKSRDHRVVQLFQ